MSPHRERNLVRIGVIGVAVSAAVVLATLQYDQLQFLSGGVRYSAAFSEAGGLTVGDNVTVAGVDVGKVDKVELDGQQVLVTFTVSEGIMLGDATGADIKTNTVLGKKSLAVAPEGSGTLRVGETIPIERTNSPYSLTDALGDLGNSISELNTDQLDKSLDAVSGALQDTPPELRAALDGVSRLSRSINERDESLLELLKRAEGVTQVLSDRSDQINSLIVDGNELFGELERRRDAINELIVNTSAVSRQLSGLVQENQAQMGPTLDNLNQAVAVLQRNKQNIADALDGLGPYIGALGETVASGPYFKAYVSNILPSMWWKTALDAGLAPDQLPQDLQDLIPESKPYTREPGQ